MSFESFRRLCLSPKNVYFEDQIKNFIIRLLLSKNLLENILLIFLINLEILINFIATFFFKFLLINLEYHFLMSCIKKLIFEKLKSNFKKFLFNKNF